MADETTSNTPTDGADIPPVDATTTAYLVTYSRAGAYARYGRVNAHNDDEAWSLANANVVGTDWVVTRVIVQPTYTGAGAAP